MESVKEHSMAAVFLILVTAHSLIPRVYNNNVQDEVKMAANGPRTRS